MVRLDADQHLLHFGVLFVQIVRVVRCHQRDAGVLRQLHKIGQQLALLPQSVILYLQIVVALAEQIAVPQGGFLCAVVIAACQQARNFTRQTRRQRNEPFVVFLEQCLVDARFGIEPLRPRLADHGDQVAVALFVFAKQHQMIAARVQFAQLVKPAARRHVAFAADDRFYPGFFCSLIEFDRAEHGTVVGNRRRRHSLLFQVVHQSADPARAVEQAVFGMQMQMCKGHGAPPMQSTVDSRQSTAGELKIDN